VTGYLETLLQDEAVDPSSRGPLQEMQRQAQRMNGIVNDLLELSRLDALAEEPVGEAIDVQAMCAMLRKDVLARPSHPDIRVEIHTKARLIGDEPEILSASPTRWTTPRSTRPPAGRSCSPATDDAGRPGSVTDTGPASRRSTCQG
jgi:two-component system phosphate regulon sensor histidine kinase PhoR